jgi:hypothetical protein
MNQGEIYAKTEEGARELKERKRNLLPDFAKALARRMGIDAATPIVGELEQLIVRGD